MNKKYRKCSYCQNDYIANSVAKECSIKCRLLNRIEIKGNCWEWKGKITTVGYGEIRNKQKHCLTHRLSYEVFKGVIPKNTQVCHKCDNKKCMNPEHLWLGTQKENIQDAKKKKRLSKQPMKKLTMKQAKDIRKRLSNGESSIVLGKEYNVSTTVISFIKHQQHYREDDLSH